MVNEPFVTRAIARSRAFAEQFARLYRRCSIDVLVVADGQLYFNDEDFGLSDFLGIIGEDPVRASVRITTAHRGNPGAARLNGAKPNFVFSDASLAGFEQVWLFAFDPAGKLSPDEVSAVTRFMQAGKGVFATGDHENLGLAMCGEIPRVRSMRKWYWPGPGPLGEPRAPDGSTASRHDTNRPGRNGAFSFDDQSDAIPQPITPTMYSVMLGINIVERYPHPLLCGPHGPIRVLPDHPHEGECIVPPVLDRVLDVGPPGNRMSVTEFPLDSAGHRVVPDVIATSRMLPGASVPGVPGKDDGKPPIPGGSFGAIGTYDGHRAGVGRIVVDATWHHFININLTGTPTGSDAEKKLGFLHAATLPAGHPERVRIERDYAQIRAYFQNIVMWLAPPTTQQCLAHQSLRYVAKSYPLVEELANVRDKRLTFDDHVQIGASGYTALAALTRPCASIRILIDLRPPRLLKVFPIDPWHPVPHPEPPPLLLDTRALELANLGAVLVELHQLDDGADGGPSQTALEQALTAGLARGRALIGDALQQHAASVGRYARLDKEASSY
jgi:hypothetical protein